MNFRNVLATVLILIGVAYLLGSFGLYEVSDIIANWWPIILLIFGVERIATSKSSLLFGVSIILIGLLILAGNLGFYQGGFWDAVLPIILILIGISLIFPRTRRHKHSNAEGSDAMVHTIFGSSDKKVKDAFSGGKIVCVFGGANLNLLEARAAEKEMVVDIDCVFGGVQIAIPRNWKVESNGSPIFGGYEENVSQETEESSPVLVINHDVIFGGVEINNNPKR